MKKQSKKDAIILIVVLATTATLSLVWCPSAKDSVLHDYSGFEIKYDR